MPLNTLECNHLTQLGLKWLRGTTRIVRVQLFHTRVNLLLIINSTKGMMTYRWTKASKYIRRQWWSLLSMLTVLLTSLPSIMSPNYMYVV